MGKRIYSTAKSLITKYGVFYTIGFIIVFALKYYYSRANIGNLDWILAPTTWWVQILSGIPFEKVQQLGYVNHEYQFIIAPVCAGINFMIIALSTLFFSLTHRLKTIKRRICWMISCIGVVYLYTIVVNSLRIILSIFLLRLDIYYGWLTPERLHTIEGTVVYFIALLMIYFIGDESLKHIIPVSYKNNHDKKSYKQGFYKYIIPVFLYFAITLGIPFLNGAFRNNRTNFLEHAVLVTVVCSSVVLLLCLVYILKKLAFNTGKVS